jgi:LysM repeat protein
VAVSAVTESQTIDAAGNLSDVYEITFTVADKPGSFTVNVPKTGDPVQAAAAAVGATREQVLGIYDLTT